VISFGSLPLRSHVACPMYGTESDAIFIAL
jgi:hypothetical protein